MVRYGAYDGRVRMDAAKAIARDHADTEDIHSFVSDEYFVLGVDDQRLLIDLRRGKYDIIVDGETIGKYVSWDPAADHFDRVLADRAEASPTSG